MTFKQINKLYLILFLLPFTNVEARLVEKASNSIENKKGDLVVSVNGILDSENQKFIAIDKKYNELMNNYCKSEKEIFCKNESNSFSCLKKNYELLTGNCLRVIQSQVNNGIGGAYLNIHDLSISKNTEYLGVEKKINHKLSTYKSEQEFSYRNIDFRKGIFKVRLYPFEEYNGQFVISSGIPSSIFKDNSGIEYNPLWQKGPFFFDEKGNVTIGTLSKKYEYKRHIYLKRGSIVVFDKNRHLIKGVLAENTKIGACGLLENMIISEEKINSCKF